MKVQSLRMGFATNSSSSHSIVFMRPGQELSNSPPENQWYGWDQFTLLAPYDKLAYVGQILKGLYEQVLTADDAARIATSLVAPYGGQPVIRPGGDVDHQSVIHLPVARYEAIGGDDSPWHVPVSEGHYGVDKAFLADFLRHILRPAVAILGGNDNDGEMDTSMTSPAEPWHRHEGVRPFGDILHSNGTWARKDPLGYWSLFNADTGTKVRFSFEDGVEIVRASAPELADMCVTTKCDAGCKWCYMDAKHEGKDAKLDDVKGLLRACKDMGVFEVAFGGGEPTLYPAFAELLRTCRKDYAIVPNFTTRNLSWLRDSGELLEAVRDVVGGFAYTAHRACDAREFLRLWESIADCRSRHKASLQIVMGTMGMDDVEEVWRVAAVFNARVTMLGYKAVGRGKSFMPLPYGDWLRRYRSLPEDLRPLISIDTTLAKQSLVDLQEAQVPGWAYEVREGGYSMFMDAVGMRMGPCSFAETEAIGKDCSAKHVSKRFREWQGVES